MKLLVQMQRLIPLAFRQLSHRNPRPPGNNTGNLILRHRLMHQRQILLMNRFLLLRQLLLKLRKLAVLQLRRLIQIIILLRRLNLLINILNFLTQLGETLHRGFFIIPLSLLPVKFIPKLRKLSLKMLQPLLAQTIRLLFQSRLFNLKLHDFPAQLIQLRRHRIKLRLNQSTGFIHQVNRLIRQKTVGNIAIGECSRRHKRRVRNLNAVEHLVALLQPS